MSSNAPERRGFLRSLVALPLLGGGVTLIGNPTAAAVVPDLGLLRSYNTWLAIERNRLCQEMEAAWPLARGKAYEPNNAGWWFHWRDYGEPDIPPASTRAAVVLAAVGCPLLSAVSCPRTEVER